MPSRPASRPTLLGDTPAMVLKTYAHLIPGKEQRARQTIDAAFTGCPVSRSLRAVE